MTYKRQGFYSCALTSTSHGSDGLLLSLCGKKNEVSDYLPFLAPQGEKTKSSTQDKRPNPNRAPSSSMSASVSLSISIALSLPFSIALALSHSLLHWGTGITAYADKVNCVAGPYGSVTGTRYHGTSAIHPTAAAKHHPLVEAWRWDDVTCHVTRGADARGAHVSTPLIQERRGYGRRLCASRVPGHV